MARPLKPLVHSGGWYPSKKWIPLVRNGGYTTQNGGEPPVNWSKVLGVPPLSLPNAAAYFINSLKQVGKCTVSGTDITCNNGKLVAVDDELPSGYERQIGFVFAASTYYLISGFYLRGSDTVRFSFSADKACNVFGCYTTNSATDNYSLYASTSSGGKYLRYDGATYNSFIPSAQIGERIDAVITPTGTSGMPTDSVITPAEFEATADLCIGTTSTSASSSKLDGNIWGNFIVDGRLTLIPCKRLSDDALGYYDLDSDTFYEPVGSAPTSLGVDTSHLTALSVDGTPEVLTVGEQTATVENLLAVDDIKDEQNIISGAVTRRCEAVISDGTTPSGRYIGEVGEGNIIVKVRETGYEGDVVTFEADRAEPLNGLTVNVEPIQDLHGYDSPWPAGGGVNLANFPENQTLPTSDVYIDALDFGEDRTIANCTLSFFVKNAVYENGGGAIVDFLKDDGTHQYRISSVYGLVQGTPNTGKFSKAETNITFRTLRIFCNEAQYARWTGGTMSVQFELSATASDKYYPYSNICSISGRTSATVTRTGKNLLNPANYVFNERTQSGLTYTVQADGSIHVTGTATSTGGPGLTGNIEIPNGTYTWNNLQGSENVYFVVRKRDKVSGATSSVDPTFTADGTFSIYVNLFCKAVGTYDLTIYPQLEVGSTATAYEPYQGNTYTIQLGDTVYGGTLDVTGGKMVVDRVKYSITGEETYSQFSNNRVLVLAARLPFVPKTPGNVISNAFKPVQSTANPPIGCVCVYNNGNIAFGVDTSVITNISDWTAFATENNLHVVYELETPIEITLTPTQIDTLIGQNNIWSDAGAVKAYVADGDVIEHVTAQPMRTAEGTNTVSVTSNVDPVELSVEYAIAVGE